VTARLAGAGERAWRWAKRRPAAAALVAVSGVLVLVLVAGGVALSFDAQIRGLNTQLRGALFNVEQQRARAEGLLYFMSIGRAHSAWRENDGQRADDILRACRPAQRNWEWHYLHRLCHSDVLTLRGHTSQVWGVAWSPDGGRLASASPDGTAKVWDAKTGQQALTLEAHGDAVFAVAWSPDCRRLATACRDWTVRVWDAPSGREVFALKGHADPVWSVASCPDGGSFSPAAFRGGRFWVASLWAAQRTVLP
jgi:WD40 repeat protein